MKYKHILPDARLKFLWIVQSIEKHFVYFLRENRVVTFYGWGLEETESNLSFSPVVFGRRHERK